jgi:hypothetical protein
MRAQLDHRFAAPGRRVVLVACSMLLLAACQQHSGGASAQELAWARAALERTPNLEIVATDSQAGVFTVRDRASGAVHAVKATELAAVPLALLSRADVAAGAATPSVDTTPDSGAAESTATPATEDPTVAAATPSLEDAAADMAGLPTSEPDSRYKIERHDGRVKVSGPGVSIVSGSAAPPPSAKGEPGQRTVDPIICDGQQMMHLDDRDIYVDGDAITVRNGCELYITNSRIVAAATGVVVRDGVVHISNSYVEGAAASFDAKGDARLYVRSSIFQGLSRRDAIAMIDDQGGNRGLPPL